MKNSFHFFVRRVLAARLTKLARFQTVGMLFPVLRGGVIPVFAFAALQSDNFSHRPAPLLDDLNDGACSYRVAAFSNRKPQSLFQCYRRDQTHFHAHVISRHHHLHSIR